MAHKVSCVHCNVGKPLLVIVNDSVDCIRWDVGGYILTQKCMNTQTILYTTPHYINAFLTQCNSLLYGQINFVKYWNIENTQANFFQGV